MLTITVAQDGSGDFASIAEAVLAVPYEEEALVQVGPGLYREKLICEKRCITLRGAGADRTRLVWGDGGKLPHKDGRPTHTFRSYTAFFSGGTLCVEDMTIENDAGPGAQAGQAVAAYVDSARAVFRRVKLLGNQDTLFCAPLPEKEREKDGFLGPRGLAPRRPTAECQRSEFSWARFCSLDRCQDASSLKITASISSGLVPRGKYGAMRSTLSVTFFLSTGSVRRIASMADSSSLPSEDSLCRF